MERPITAALILGGSLLIAGWLSGGLYTVVKGEEQAVFVVNRFTGTVMLCGQGMCLRFVKALDAPSK